MGLAARLEDAGGDGAALHPKLVRDLLLRQPLEAVQLTSKFDFTVKVDGGGITGQAGAIRRGLAQLSVAKLLDGFRGKPRGDLPALIELVLGITRYASAHIEQLVELDVNPVIVRPNGLGAVAVDTLIRMREP